MADHSLSMGGSQYGTCRMIQEKLEIYLAGRIANQDLEVSSIFYPYVYETLLQASFAERAGSSEVAGHFSPAKCLGLLTDRLKAEFGSYASWVLESWNVSDSRQVGQVIFDLAAAGCLSLSGDETLEDFEKAGFWV
jgi:uncharacterized repeat protein (TIGR04138 family)